MQRLAWATDTHLEFADPQTRERFAEEIRVLKADALLITGDVSNSKQIEPLLRELQKRIQIPIWFNLGNHDYYGGLLYEVRVWANEISNSNCNLFWIEEAGVIRLNSETCLVGVDGWGDGRLGNYRGSRVLLADWDHIFEFLAVDAMLDRRARLDLLGKLGDEAADTIRKLLRQALPSYKKVLLMTHVPPWKEATWHEGKPSDDDFLPWFSCKAVGDAIVEEAAKHPDVKITVLCGHTHGRGYSKINDQIEVYTGGAQYRTPEVQNLFDVQGPSIVKVMDSSWFKEGY